MVVALGTLLAITPPMGVGLTVFQVLDAVPAGQRRVRSRIGKRVIAGPLQPSANGQERRRRSGFQGPLGDRGNQPHSPKGRCGVSVGQLDPRVQPPGRARTGFVLNGRGRPVAS